MNTYNIGPLTQRYVFERSGLTNASDWQAVLDAVEDGLAAIEQVGYNDGMNDGFDAAGPEV